MSRALVAAVALSAALARASAAGTPPRIVWVDDELRLRRADAAAALSAGAPLPATGGKIALVAFRGETLAFQVVLVAGEAPLGGATLTLTDLTAAGAPSARVHPTIYAEHYLRVDRRSRNAAVPAESLGWSPGARPADAEVMGELPDALLPAAAAAPIAPGQTGAFWVDLAIPESARPGLYRGAAVLAAGGGKQPLAAFDLAIEVRPPLLPYRATSVMLFYETSHLEARFGSDAPAVERQLWQLFHAHHIDALAQTGGADDVARLRVAYNGSLFTPRMGYGGPGAGLPPEVVALGTYGALHAPAPASLARLDEMLARLPAGRVADVFLYAVDEQCRSPLPAAWAAALVGRPARARLQVAATCDLPPARQTAEIAILPADAYRRGSRAEAEKAGRRAWIYNGRLPRTGTLLLDADPRGLTANGWIAALADIERWFYWESTFWDDDGPGGHGRVDPWATAETFHNRDGDSCLGDGLLVYPGAGGVVPSLRLEALRRGIEDAGLIALAARERPRETAAIVGRALPAVLDEAPPTGRASWERAGALRFGAARAALRALISRADPLSDKERRDAFRTLAASRAGPVPGGPPGGGRRFQSLAARAVLALAALLALAGVAAAVARRRRRTATLAARPFGQ